MITFSHSLDVGPCNGLNHTYRAFCDLLEVPAIESFISFTYDLHETGEKILDLAKVPGVDGHGSPSISLQTIGAALAFNTYFK